MVDPQRRFCVEEWFPSNHVNIESLEGGRGGLRGRVVEKDDARNGEEK